MSPTLPLSAASAAIQLAAQNTLNKKGAKNSSKKFHMRELRTADLVHFQEDDEIASKFRKARYKPAALCVVVVDSKTHIPHLLAIAYKKKSADATLHLKAIGGRVPPARGISPQLVRMDPLLVRAALSAVVNFAVITGSTRVASLTRRVPGQYRNIFSRFGFCLSALSEEPTYLKELYGTAPTGMLTATD